MDELEFICDCALDPPAAGASAEDLATFRGQRVALARGIGEQLSSSPSHALRRNESIALAIAAVEQAAAASGSPPAPMATPR